MSKTIVVCGHGPGISDAVARKFGQNGFQVALVARSADKLQAAAARLAGEGIQAKAFPCDLGDPSRVKQLFADVAGALGPTTVLHWNAYVGAAGDLLSAKPEELRSVLSVAVDGLVAAVQAAVPQMKGQSDAAVLVTGGGFSKYDDNVDKMGVEWGAMGLSVAKAAQHKLTRLLHQRLGKEGIYVGEVTVLGMVKGTAFDSGNATLEPSAIADAFWKLHQDRAPLAVPFS